MALPCWTNQVTRPGHVPKSAGGACRAQECSVGSNPSRGGSARGAAGVIGAAMKQFVALARVRSREQEREGLARSSRTKTPR